MRIPVSRIAALAGLVALALIPAAAQQLPPSPLDALSKIEIHAQAIEAFDPRDRSRRTFGKLTFRGGLILKSPNDAFGGLSALRVAADGEHFLSMSDRGDWLRGRIVYRDGAPVAVADGEMAPILGPDGAPLKALGWYDTEALALAGGTAFIGIERVQEIVRLDYGKDGLSARAHAVAAPPGIKQWPSNRSLECLEALPKGGPLSGSLVAISERALDSHGDLLSFVFGGASAGAFSLKRHDDFDVSDCAVTPDGRLLVLERRFSWTSGVAIRIRAVPLASIKPGALVDGPELFFADMADDIDNMEGLSVHRDSSGALVLTMISDDNFSPLQRTLLLQFTLD